MFKELPIKREYLLVALTLIAVLICYQLAFKRTIEAWHIHTGLEKQMTQGTDLTYQPGYLERKNNNLDNIINLYKADTVDFRSNIISKISSMAEQENAKLTEVPTKDPFYHTGKSIIQKLTFEGDYFSLLKLLNKLQSTSGIGMVRASGFKSTVNLSSGDRAKKLTLEVYMEIVSR